MNTLTGEITEITTDRAISLVKVLSGGHLFYSIILDTPELSPWLKKGAPIRLLFKETEVMIALPSPHSSPTSALNPSPTPYPTSLRISVRNQIPCHISSITRGAILCELTLTPSTSGTQPASHQPLSPKTISAIITRAACDELSLKENDAIIALIKTNEVSLAHD